MLTYPLSFLNAGGEYDAAIGRRFVHYSVMDKYHDSFQRTLEVRQAENFIEFKICYDPYPRAGTGDTVEFPVRVWINELRWSTEILRGNTNPVWHGFAGQEGGCIDFETCLGPTPHVQITASLGEENEDFDDGMSVSISQEDWVELLDLIDAMIEDYDERESRRVEITATHEEWVFAHQTLSENGDFYEAGVIEREIDLDSTSNKPCTLVFYANDHDVDAVRESLKFTFSLTFNEWMLVANDAMERRNTAAATEILHTLAWHDYGRNDTEQIEVRFDLQQYNDVWPSVLDSLHKVSV